MKNYHGIMIDESRTDQLPEYSQYLIKESYAKGTETIQEAFARPSLCWGSNLAHSQRLYEYASNRMFMFASPVFANAVLPGEKLKALPISCYLPYIADDIPSLLFQKVEYALLSVMGGGIGQYWGDVRPISKKAPGPIPFLKENDAGILAWKQGLRRGALCGYLGVGHPDVQEFLKIRLPTGDVSRKCLNIHHALNFPDSFMEALERGDDEFQLIDPSNQEVKGSINPREFWMESLFIRGRTGEPFMYFIDTANRFLPLPQKVLGMRTHASNLCTEITLAASKTRTPVCCLSSVNLETQPIWKDYPLFISDLIEMLDNVIQAFIDNIDNIAKNYTDDFDQEFVKVILSKVKRSATMERSVGLGAMGFHYLLQSLGLPFDSQEARDLNISIFKDMKDQAHDASVRLGIERGVCPDVTDYIEWCEKNNIPVDPYWVNRRNMHLLAIAPNANNSVIIATSPSCEPAYANLFSQEMRTGTFAIKNKYLEKLLESYGKNTVEVWDLIADNDSSVKDLEFLTDKERKTFLNFLEIDQMAVVDHAADRQPFICQAQSVNLAFPPSSDINYVSRVHYVAWKRGLKSLYYYRTESDKKVERVSKLGKREVIEEIKNSIVYGTPACSQCNIAKRLLESYDIEFDYIDLVAIGKTAAEVTGRSVRSVPQIYIKGEYVGGLKELQKYLSDLTSVQTESGECLSCSG